ncbi:MAG: hybrid sensor histidine kinase/response regulator, partial [Povalibacter sp.]
EEIGGIGLTVVRNIVRAMQGALDIESERGRGTNVRVYWPALDCTTHVPEARCTSEQGQGQSVLVVDDEPELVRVAEEIVASLGYEAVGFRDSSAALDSFRAEPARFDAVITDERMPVMRGTALARAIHEVRPDVPVLLVTGFRDSHVDQRAREAGIDIILDKPLRAKHLHAALSRALPH